MTTIIITLTRTGGFGGIPLKKTIDTTKLLPEEAKKVEELIHNNPINKYTNKQIKSYPDRFTYTISVQDDEVSQEVIIDEKNLTEITKNLITYLEHLERTH